MKTYYKNYLLVVGLCISLSAVLVIANAPTTQAKSIPDTLIDLLTGRKDSPANTSKAEPVKSVAPTPTTTPQAQQPVSQPAVQVQSTTKKAETTTAATTAVQTAAVKPVDTSTQVRQVASAQAVKTNYPSTYSSSKISDTQRNDFYKASLVAVAVGSLLYLLSFAPTWNWFYRNTVASSKTITE